MVEKLEKIGRENMKSGREKKSIMVPYQESGNHGFRKWQCMKLSIFCKYNFARILELFLRQMLFQPEAGLQVPEQLV